jgi:carbamoylphosphate synthase large subunit
MSESSPPPPPKDVGTKPLPDFSSHSHSKQHEPLHERTSSDLSDLVLLELDRNDDDEQVEIVVNEDVTENTELPISTLVVVTDTEKVGGEEHTNIGDVSLADIDFSLDAGSFQVHDWNGLDGYSDYIAQGLKYKGMEDTNIVMLFESPSSSTAESSFHNKSKFKFHDWPPPKSTKAKGVLGPCRYASMNGSSFPVFLRDGTPPAGLVEHWAASIPDYTPAHYVNKITDQETVYAYLPVEQIQHHLNDPDIHYHLAGKDTIHMMTQKTTKLLPDTSTIRPCVVKTTHSMGSKGIFIIQNDDDEAEFAKFLEDSGHPTFVIVEFVDIARNVACHFFIHPDGSITWLGSNENHRMADGSFSSDSYLLMEHQTTLKEMQLPFVEEVTKYCHGLGFWGFCGIDVLFDSNGKGHLVDINPRVTGSCPALMTLKKLQQAYDFSVGLFRRSGDITFYGTTQQLFERVAAFNEEKEGKMRIIIHSVFSAPDKETCRINIGVYGNSLAECKEVLNQYAQPSVK